MNNTQLIWNLTANSEERNIKYFFAIINAPREAEAIRNRLISALAPVEEIDFHERKGRIHQTNYHILSLKSSVKLENLSQIYKGKIKKDERLYEREKDGMDGLEAYVISKLQKQ